MAVEVGVEPASSSPAAIHGLEPAAVWQHFAQLAQIPRPSKHEGRVLEWLKGLAAARNLSWQQDDVGNLVIRRPGCGGGEAAPPVVIQGHLDMVCEKNQGVAHDFLRDGITLRREGDWLMAVGTTLGADNGLGVATALALLDLPASTSKLPPLECLFTVDEETGLTGAFDISPDLLQGRTMLNLDTEDWGELFIGCAGGGDSRLLLEVQLEEVAGPAARGLVPHKLRLGGLLGGHSGLNIHEGRGNAVQLLARLLRGLLRAVPGARLASVDGGDKRNAIAREAHAVILLPESQRDAVQALLASRAQELRATFGQLETELFVCLEDAGAPPAATPSFTAVTQPDTQRLLTLLTSLPHGPLKFSHAVAGLVETSNNVASVKVQPGSSSAASPSPAANTATYLVVTSTRSSLGHELEAVRDVIEDVANLVGARMERGKAYPGWQPRLDSPVLQVTCDAYAAMNGGQAAKVGAIHAGLECGILGEKFPGMDTVSFGPTIKGAHSPDERVLISTVPPFWQLTLEVLSRLADRRAPQAALAGTGQLRSSHTVTFPSLLTRTGLPGTPYSSDDKDVRRVHSHA